MKREGFISIIALMLMSLVLASCTYISYAVSIQSKIASNNQKNIQARLTTEDKINKLLYDSWNFENIVLDEIYKTIRNQNPPYKKDDSNRDGIPDEVKLPTSKEPSIESNLIAASMRLEGSNETLKLNTVPANFEESTKIVIRLLTEYEGIKNQVEIKGKIINKIFEIKEPYISGLKMLECDLLEEFIDLMDLIEEEIYDHDPRGTVSVAKYNLENDGIINEDFIIEQVDQEEKEYEYKTKLNLINIMAGEDKKPSWEIINNKNPSQKIFIRGNIYCEGDLIISTPFELEGNLILNKGRLIINTDTKPIIKGKVLDRAFNDIDISNLKLDTEKKYIYKYGSYLPGFIDFRIDVIKNK